MLHTLFLIRFSFDETLWRRMDLSNKTLRPGVLGRALDRGVAVLRLAKSEVRMRLRSAHAQSRPLHPTHSFAV